MDNSRKLDSFQDGEKEGCELASVSVRKSSASPEQVQSRDGTPEGRLSVAVGSPSHHSCLFWGSVSKHEAGRTPSTNEESHTSSGHTENLRPTADSGRVTPGRAAQGSRHPPPTRSSGHPTPQEEETGCMGPPPLSLGGSAAPLPLPHNPAGCAWLS